MWQPEQYSQFFELRVSQTLDLFTKLPKSFTPKTVIDVGCGQGITTRYLADAYKKAKLIGIDNSEAMLRQAKISYPKINFSFCEIEDFSGKYDLIFSNAPLHWLQDYEAGFAKIAQAINPGGYFAAQIPANFNAPSHTILRDIITKNPEWLEKMQNSSLFRSFLTPENCFSYWQKLGYKVQLWTSTYYQDLIGENPVLEWVRGPILGEMTERLPSEAIDQILKEYAPLVKEAYPRDKSGVTMFPFTRLFFIVSGK